MRILQLNVWTGRIKGALLDFFKENDFDVICLQEAVWSDSELLENFCVTVDQIKEASGLEFDFRSANWEVEAFGTKVLQGNVVLSGEKMVKCNSHLVHGKYLTYKTLGDSKRQGYTLQVVKLANGITVVNHHGYWLPTPVGDETTVEVMRKVAGFVKEIKSPLVMCGDLNIIHVSPAMRQLDFLRDLTDEFGISNTLAGLKFNGKVACDHILVSPDIEVEEFQVLEKTISDHKALVVEINDFVNQ